MKSRRENKVGRRHLKDMCTPQIEPLADSEQVGARALVGSRTCPGAAPHPARLPGLLLACSAVLVLLPVFASTLRLVHILFSGLVPKPLSVPVLSVPPPLLWLLSASLSVQILPAGVAIPLRGPLSALGV